MSSTDWTPLISGVAALLSVTPIIMVRYLGLEPSILQHSTPTTPQPTTDSTITIRLDVLEGQYNNLSQQISDTNTSLSSLTQALSQLAQAQANTSC